MTGAGISTGKTMFPYNIYAYHIPMWFSGCEVIYTLSGPAAHEIFMKYISL